jgi:hypothetical protein
MKHEYQKQQVLQLELMKIVGGNERKAARICCNASSECQLYLQCISILNGIKGATIRNGYKLKDAR